MATPFTIDNYYFSSNIATSNGGGVLSNIKEITNN